jgi:hypothetical protein
MKESILVYTPIKANSYRFHYWDGMRPASPPAQKAPVIIFAPQFLDLSRNLAALWIKSSSAAERLW